MQHGPGQRRGGVRSWRAGLATRRISPRPEEARRPVCPASGALCDEGREAGAGLAPIQYDLERGERHGVRSSRVGLYTLEGCSCPKRRGGYESWTGSTRPAAGQAPASADLWF